MKPLGLINAPSTFQRMMNQPCTDLEFVRVYFDNVVIFSQTMEELLDHSEELLERLSKHNLKFEVSKYRLYQPEIKFLGRVVKLNGVLVHPEKIGEILNTPSLTTRTELRISIGV